MRQAFPPLRRALVIALSLLFLAAPVGATIHPRLLDWQARLSRMLPEGARLQAAQASDNLPATATPTELQQALQEVAPGLPRAPVELYSGLRLLQRREAILVGFARHLAVHDRARALLVDYCRQTHEALRLAPPGPAGPALPEPRANLPEPRVSREGLEVLRELPAPRPSTPRARLRRLLQAAEEDLREVTRRRAAADEAREIFLRATLVWRRHLRRLAESLDSATGLPCPSRVGAPGCVPPLVEQIPPPPPLDLPELREDPAGARSKP